MPSLILLLTRLAAQAARGDLADMRERAVRAAILTVVIAILSTAAILLLIAAAAVALAQWIGLLPALLSMAAVVVILTLILVLFLRHRPRRRPSSLMGTFSPSPRDRPQVGPLAIIAAGLAVGLFIGLRGRR
jgi:amino acid transporter